MALIDSALTDDGYEPPRDDIEAGGTFLSVADYHHLVLFLAKVT